MILHLILNIKAFRAFIWQASILKDYSFTYFFFYNTYKRRKSVEIVIPNIKHFVAHNYNSCELYEKLAISVTSSTMRVQHEELFLQIIGFEIE